MNLIQFPTPKEEAKLFFSDVHIGSGNSELVHMGFSALPRFLDQGNYQITDAVDVGDTVECWIPDEGLENSYDTYMRNEVVREMRYVYDCIFRERPAVLHAVNGNHQTRIRSLFAGDEARLEESSLAAHNLRSFLDLALEGREATINVFTGIKELEPNFFVHHGDILDAPNALKYWTQMFDDGRLTEGEFDTTTKLELINNDPRIQGEMQQLWRRFKLLLWPTIKLAPKLFDRMSQAYMDRATEKSMEQEQAEGGQRTEEDMLKNPLTPFARAQIDLAGSICDYCEFPVIVSGHYHHPTMVRGEFAELSVSLGAWKDTPFNPVIGLKTEGSFRMLEFEPLASDEGEWFVRDEESL